MDKTEPLRLLKRRAAPSTAATSAATPAADTKGQTAPFGSIRFPAVSAAPSKFVRLESLRDCIELQEDQVTNVVNVLLTTWGVAPPCAMISVPPIYDPRIMAELDNVGTQFELILQRGLAEAVAKTSAWVFTSGNGGSSLERLVGRAMLYGRSEYPGVAFTCIGVPPWERLAEKKHLSRLANGMVHRYGYSAPVPDSASPRNLNDLKHVESLQMDDVDDGNVVEAIVSRSPSPDSQKQSVAADFVLDKYHSHFLMVDGPEDEATRFRERIERHISSNDVSGDQIQTPKVLLVIAGDADCFEWVHKALDAEDESTGTSVPVLVLSDSGGAAKDIWEYVSAGKGMAGMPAGWDLPDDAARPFPVEDAYRDARYVAEAKKHLPAILRLGKETGQNTTRQLDFYIISKDVDLREDLSHAIQRAMMNDCPDVNEEALLSVVWGEPDFLQQKLEDAAGEILLGRGATEDAGVDGKEPKAPKDLLQLALLRKDVPVSKTIMKFTDSPSLVVMNELFVNTHNRYVVERAAKFWMTVQEAQGQRLRKSPRKKRTGVMSNWGKIRSTVAVMPNRSRTDTQEGSDGARNSTHDSMSSPAALDRKSSSSALLAERMPGDETGWRVAKKVLGEMVDGYKVHLTARDLLYRDEMTMLEQRRKDAPGLELPRGLVGSHVVNVLAACGESSLTSQLRMAPTFCDLMMWSVLAGAHELAEVLWRRTQEPIRASIMASQLCRLLSNDGQLRPDRDELAKHADDYEMLGIEVLENIRESHDATELLTLIPWEWEVGNGEKIEPKRRLLWANSVIESSSMEDGLLSVPCMRLVAHRHSQFTLEQYFAGEYPGSAACVPQRVSLVRIFLQMLLPILPGTLVEVMPCGIPSNRPIMGRQTAQDYQECVKLGFVKDRTTKPSISRSGTPTQGIEWDPDTLDLVSALDGTLSSKQVQATLKRSKTRKIKTNDSWHKLTMTHKEDSFMDVFADLLSLRFMQFYLVPKVKFTMHFAGHVAFIAYFALLLMYVFTADTVPCIGFTEIFFWYWCLTRFIGEVFELDSFTRTSLFVYMRDVWNMQDMLFVLLSVVAATLRVVSHFAAMSDPEWEPGDPYRRRSAVELMPRSLYAFMIILLSVRVLQYLRYFRAVGVLTIIIGHMLNDVAFFSVILLLITFGFGLAFSVIFPAATATQPVYMLFGHAPLWAPFWAIFTSFNRRFDADDEVDGMDPGILVAPTLLWIYLFISTIILVNLLIAQMSDTYVRVSSQGLLVWQFERAQLIDEFKDTKPPLPPPFNVVWYFFVMLPSRALRRYRERYHGEVEADKFGFKSVPRYQELKVLRQRESEALQLCLRARERRDAETMEMRIQNLQDASAKLEEQARTNFESINGRLDELRHLQLAAHGHGKSGDTIQPI